MMLISSYFGGDTWVGDWFIKYRRPQLEKPRSCTVTGQPAFSYEHIGNFTKEK